jgi:SAM-dependent methyltransferase
MTQTAQAPTRPGPAGPALPWLLAESSAYGALTVDLLRRAGVEPGMRVLDAGCGTGDSTFAAAAVVGPAGEVLGVDRSHAAVARASARAASAGIENVRFAAADIEAVAIEGGFDAVIGRNALVHLRRPAAALARIAAAAEPGGIVAFQELVVSSATTSPVVPLYARVNRLLHATLSAAGLDPDLGRQLHGVFRDAGLPAPSLHLAAPVAHAADPAVHAEAARMLRGVLPLTKRLNVASPHEVQIDTLAARLHADALTADATVFLPSLVGAWVRLPG